MGVWRDFDRVEVAVRKMVQGATHRVTITVKDSSGAAVDISYWNGPGKGIRCDYRTTLTAAPLIATPIPSFVSSGTGGQFMLLTHASVTATVSASNLVGDVEFYDTTQGADEVVVKPCLVTFSVEKEGTRPGASV